MFIGYVKYTTGNTTTTLAVQRFHTKFGAMMFGLLECRARIEAGSEQINTWWSFK